ncbi:MAG: hypothetical protein U0997_06710 [Sulfurimicrobium sp.]|nr:hypothetical protein [Sulfurimicrobium sp.]
MDYPTLSIELDGCWLKFHRQGSPASGASWPLLAEIGTLRSTARASHLAGIGAGEAPSISVVLNNPKRRASDLIGFPLRRRARIEDASGVLFEGVISDIGYGNTLTLEISA